jgi:hypothetical protein
VAKKNSTPYILAGIIVILVIGGIITILSFDFELPSITTGSEYDEIYFSYLKEQQDTYFSEGMYCLEDDVIALRIYLLEHEDATLDAVKANLSSSGYQDSQLFSEDSYCYIETACPKYFNYREQCKERILNSVDLSDDIIKEMAETESGNVLAFLRENLDSEEDVCRTLSDERFSEFMNDSIAEDCVARLGGNDAKNLKEAFIEKQKSFFFAKEYTVDNFIDFCEYTDICACDPNSIDPFEFHKDSYIIECPGKGYGDLFDETRIPEESERFPAPDAGMIFEDAVALQSSFERGLLDSSYDRQALCAHFDSCEGLSGDTLQLCNAFNGRSCETNNYENVMTVWHPEYCIVMNQVEPVREYMKNIICQN